MQLGYHTPPGSCGVMFEEEYLPAETRPTLQTEKTGKTENEDWFDIQSCVQICSHSNRQQKSESAKSVWNLRSTVSILLSSLNVFDGAGVARDPAGKQLSATVGDLKVVANFLG